MKKISSPLLPFKLSVTNEKITANAGLVLFGEFIHSQRFCNLLDQKISGFKSSHNYKPSEFITPLLLMLNGGGRHIEDLRKVAIDKALLELLQIKKIPSTSATGDWFRFLGNQKLGFIGLSRFNSIVNKRALKATGKRDFTLDIDATQIVAHKKHAKFTYKGERGYMPIIGHIAETGMVIHDEFRDGNISPSTRNFEFIKSCLSKMPNGIIVSRFRADSASYQASIFNLCEEKSAKFAIGGRLDESVKEIISQLKPEAWKKYQGTSSITRVTHCMQKTNKAFDLIIIRRPWQPNLLDESQEESNRYTLIATNIKGKMESIVRWYNQRGEASENRIKELKIGFNMEYMPCGTTKANAVFFRIGVLAYNLFRLFKLATMPSEWAKHTVQTIRWKFYNTAAKIVSHAGQVWLRLRKENFNIFQEVRSKIRDFALANF